MPGPNPELPEDVIPTLNAMLGRAAEAYAALQPPPGPWAERRQDVGRALRGQRTGIMGVSPEFAREFVTPASPTRFEPFKTYSQMAEEYRARGLAVPPPEAYDPWAEDVATRLRSALFATKQGWDWTWDQPGVYNRPGADIADVCIGMELVMKRLGIPAPYDLDADLPIPYTPTPAADEIDTSRRLTHFDEAWIEVMPRGGPIWWNRGSLNICPHGNPRGYWSRSSDQIPAFSPVPCRQCEDDDRATWEAVVQLKLTAALRALANGWDYEWDDPGAYAGRPELLPPDVGGVYNRGDLVFFRRCPVCGEKPAPSGALHECDPAKIDSHRFTGLLGPLGLDQ